MKIFRKIYLLPLAALISVAAIILFFLDYLNVDVTPVSAYLQKDTAE